MNELSEPIVTQNEKNEGARAIGYVRNNRDNNLQLMSLLVHLPHSHDGYRHVGISVIAPALHFVERKSSEFV